MMDRQTVTVVRLSHFFLAIRRFINEKLLMPWIDVLYCTSVFTSLIDWSSLKSGFGSFSTRPPCEVHVTQYVSDASWARMIVYVRSVPFSINWVAKTIWSAKRKMWIVPRMSFGFSNLSSYFWISSPPSTTTTVATSPPIYLSIYQVMCRQGQI